MKKIYVSCIMSAILASFSAPVIAAVDSETESASVSLGAKMVTEISFEERSSTLSSSAKEEIQSLIQSARKSGKIDELKIAAWADREYPAPDTKASKGDIELAKQRAESVKTYMKNEMKVSGVNTYNMTERPNALQKFLHTPGAKVKTAMEESGAVPRTSAETGFFGQKAKTSKAIIMVFIK